MLNMLFIVLIGLGIGSGALAQPPQALDDAELSDVSGADGISFAMHLALNDPNLVNPVTDSRLSVGFDVDGKTTYIVIKNLSGMIDLATINLSARKKPDGNDYMALTLPGFVKYTNFGYESLSVQTSPLAPVTESLGRFNVNGTLSMQGEFRFWAN
jgi:hypothetical protein